MYAEYKALNVDNERGSEKLGPTAVYTLLVLIVHLDWFLLLTLSFLANQLKGHSI